MEIDPEFFREIFCIVILFRHFRSVSHKWRLLQKLSGVK